MESDQPEYMREVRLGEVLEITTVQTLYGELKQAMDGDGSLSIDGSAVTKIDTATMQVLVAVFAYADLHKRSIELRSPSQPLRNTAEILGVSAAVGLT